MSTNSKGIVSRTSLGALALAGGLALVDALAVEPNRLRVVRVDVPAGAHTDRLAGLKIAHLTDLHVGGVGWRPAVAARAVDLCNREDADLIAVTGDLLGHGSAAKAAVEILSLLRSDVPRLAVLGNHDHVYGRRPLDALCGGMQDLGIRLLWNEAVPMEMRFGRVWIVGVDDGYSARDDVELALRRLGRDDFPRVLLTHYPDVANQLRPGEVQLSLSGHTHAGQIRVPVLTRLVNNGHARTGYGHGMYLVNGNPLYVSAGLGMSGVPVRFRNWPEVTMVRFVAAPSARGADLSPVESALALAGAGVIR